MKTRSWWSRCSLKEPMGCKCIPAAVRTIILTLPTGSVGYIANKRRFNTVFPASVLYMLEELPETLDETYQRTLREINKAN